MKHPYREGKRDGRNGEERRQCVYTGDQISYDAGYWLGKEERDKRIAQEQRAADELPERDFYEGDSPDY